MKDQNTEAGKKLQKLGQRLRAGLAKRHPPSPKGFETVRNAVQEQFPKDIEEMGRRIKIDPKLIAPKAPEVESEEEREQEET